jgi:hypothetical protein
MSQQTTQDSDLRAQIILESLWQTAAKTLDRKRRLGHHAVIWQDNAPLAVGEDAQPELKQSSSFDTPSNGHLA